MTAVDDKKRQHILPETYLKHWVDPATIAPGRTPMVWTFSKDGERKKRRPVADRCFWREYFYDLISVTGERRQDLENLLGKFEDVFARIVEKRITHKQPLEPDEAENLDLFVACMFMRTERMRDSMMSAALARARIERDYAAVKGETLPDTSVMEHNARGHAMYEGILLMSEHLATMSHNIFIASGEKYFLTSDTPCYWTAPHGPEALENSLLEIFFPLTPKHLLHISQTIPTSAYVEAPDYWVDQQNWEMVRHCREYFVSPSGSCWFESSEYWLEKLLSEAEPNGEEGSWRT